VDDVSFVAERLPRQPASLLEVGCGAGRLAITLAERGWDVTAIDPEAPEGAIFRRITLAELDDAGPYDAVLARRSLHHIHDLEAALERIGELLTPDGVLLVVEFAHERLVGDTADWYLGQLAALHAAGRAHAPPRDEAALRQEYRGLHTGEALLAALRGRFEEREFSWEPSLHGELRGEATEALERTLVDAGAIQATGFRWVGARRGG
jgi:SAM-dependent methyltransferase